MKVFYAFFFPEKKPSDMKCVTAECLIKSKSDCKGAAKWDGHRNTLAKAMEGMRYASNTLEWPEEATHP